MNIFTKIKNWLDGKKTILSAIAGILLAVVAWLNGDAGLVPVITAVVAFFSLIFLRLGINK